MKSIFTDKNITPNTDDLKKALEDTFDIWEILADYTKELYPGVKSEWKFSGEKYGWNYRLKDNKRVLIYLLPRDKFFKAAFVFGTKATDKILVSDISGSIKAELMAAKPYVEGRGIRIDVMDLSIIDDIKKLINIKISC